MTQDKSLYGLNISREVAERLRAYCEGTDRKVGATAERAIKEYLDRQEQATKDALDRR